jgi:uncharacterized protein with PIN domain
MSMELAREEQARLRAAGTMVELEELACEIGDEFTSQLMSLEMADRSNQAAEATTRKCPDCGEFCGQGDPKSRKLTGVRGEIHYHEPAFYCPACRRSFFPGSRRIGATSTRDSDAQVASENDLGRGQPEQL